MEGSYSEGMLLEINFALDPFRIRAEKLLVVQYLHLYHCEETDQNIIP